MTVNDFNPSSFAGAMQLRTRKEKNFEEVESNLPDPRKPKLETTQLLSVRGWLDRLGSLNPFGKAVTADDLVWLLDNTAFQQQGGSGDGSGAWRAEFVAAVFEREPRGKVVDMVTGISRVGTCAVTATGATTGATKELEAGPRFGAATGASTQWRWRWNG